MIKCNKDFNGNFNIIHQLKTILKKYKNFCNSEQNISLHLAMQYKSKGNLIKAAKHFLEAIEFDPGNKQLRVSFSR